MTNTEQSNAPAPNGSDPALENKSTREKKIAGGSRSPQKHGPGPMHDDDAKHKRGGGDVERDIPDQEDEGTRHGGRSERDMDQENGGRSRPGSGRSRNM